MDKSLLDTDILSEILKEKNPDVIRKANDYYKEFGQYTFSMITVLEVIKLLVLRFFDLLESKALALDWQRASPKLKLWTPSAFLTCWSPKL